MNRIKESPRLLWLLLGLVASLFVLAVGYFMFISGEKTTQADLQSQTDNARQQVATSRSKVAVLRDDNGNLPMYKMQLAGLSEAVPATPATASFVSDMQVLGSSSSVDITSINVAPPATGGTTDTTVAGATPLAITLTATGPTANLEQFVRLLQHDEARAVLLGQVTETVPDSAGSADAKPAINISLTAFFGRAK